MNDLSPLPPQSIAAEQAVLGALLIAACDDVPQMRKRLSRNDFYREVHGIIYDAILASQVRRGAVDFVCVCDELEGTGQLEIVGGAPYLISLINAAPTSLLARAYADIVHEKALQREQIRRGTQLVQDAYAGHIPARRGWRVSG